MGFLNYTDCLLQAFSNHNKSAEIVKRKKEILDSISNFYNYQPTSVLYVGFNPVILSETCKEIYTTNLSNVALQFLLDNNIKFTNLDNVNDSKYYKFFDVVIALDEYFTFADSEEDQKKLVANICNLTKEYLITTCRDYKNQEFKDREFSMPALVRNKSITQLFLEFHDHDLQDRNSWKTEVFQILNRQLIVAGPFARRPMFFKQLAKFSQDSGATGFTVHKNLMYKSLIKKNYEHVISIQFDNNGS